MQYSKPNLACYRFAQGVCWFVSTLIFRRKFLRNEIKGKQGPFVVIANHETALDFVNLIGATGRPMSFVISKSFFSTLPIKGILRKMGVIPKQQFQTTVRDMKRMKAVIAHGQPLVIYPAGLMCEDGLSTPIPAATYKFLKWLGVDVYVARTSGTYFVMPKWTKGMRPGRTYMDIYRLFSREELAATPVEEVERRTNEALLFDAYREQEKLQIRYSGGDCVQGLEHVLYMCPHCREEFSMEVRDRNTLHRRACGYEAVSDEYAFLHHRGGVGREIRYVSDWSRLIYEDLRQRLRSGRDSSLAAATRIHMVHSKKPKFIEVGEGTVSLCREHFLLEGSIHGQPVSLRIPIANVPSLPFSPGRHLEIQDGEQIYRCVLQDGRLVMKFINMVKIFHELSKQPVG